ncbi:heterokaryon incompatibility protein-domain-containing protein, partial [Pyrenochaeta sp. MPI-SDFR-AT-0127]
MNSPRPSNDSSGKTSSYDRISEDTIRLLLLHPGSGTEELQYELITATFDDMPHYEALSYTWNGNSNWKHIQDAAQSCHLSMNLCASLFALRKPDNNRVLWIDQICINQNDYRERGQQVQLMSKIYSRASKVLIWIG